MLFAQVTGSLNVFSENGDKFYLFLDGVQQNDSACANLRVQDLPDLYYSARISFANKAIAPIARTNLYVSDGEDVMQDVAYRIRREKSGKPKLYFYSMNAGTTGMAASNLLVVHYGRRDIKPVTVIAKKDSLQRTSGLGTLRVFSQDNDAFFLFLDGVQQNNIAQSNVLIRSVPGLYYNARIVFKDSRLPTIFKNNLFISDGDDVLMDAAYRVRRDKTGKPRLNFFSMTAVQAQSLFLPGTFVYDFLTPADAIAVAERPALVPAAKSQGLITEIRVTDPKVQKTTVPKKNTSPVKKAASAEAATASTSRPASSTKVGLPADVSHGMPGEEPAADNKKCDGWPMGKGDLAAAKKTVASAGKEDEKLKAAQEVIRTNCLYSSQVAEFCALFTTEKSRLAFAKYAYRFTLDKKNYPQLSTLFLLETSRKELSKLTNGG